MVIQLVSALAGAVLGLGSMPPKPRQPRLPAALRSALAQLQAGTAPQGRGLVLQASAE